MQAYIAKRGFQFIATETSIEKVAPTNSTNITPNKIINLDLYKTDDIQNIIDTTFSARSARERRLIETYFILLKNGKLPTAELLIKKAKLGTKEFDDAITTINHVFNSYGYKLHIFTDKETALQEVKIYSACVKSTNGNLGNITFESLCKEMNKKTEKAKMALAIDLVLEDYKLILDIDPGFAPVIAKLRDEANQYDAEVTAAKTVKKTEDKNFPAQEDINHANNNLREYIIHSDWALEYDDPDSYIKTAQDLLLNTKEEQQETKHNKIKTLFEKTGVTEADLKTAWLYWRAFKTGQTQVLAKLRANKNVIASLEKLNKFCSQDIFITTSTSQSPKIVRIESDVIKALEEAFRRALPAQQIVDGELLELDHSALSDAYSKLTVGEQRRLLKSFNTFTSGKIDVIVHFDNGQAETRKISRSELRKLISQV